MRVRQAIENLKYKSLVYRGVIPDILKLFDVETKRYPPMVYKSKDFAFFGMLMDYWVRAGFKSTTYTVHTGREQYGSKEDIEQYLSNKTVGKMCMPALRIVRVMFNQTGYADEDIVSYIPQLTNLIKSLNKELEEWKKRIGDELFYNEELQSSTLSGHPDVVSTHSILDIKTTSGFKSMGEEACLQVLAYYALARESGKDIKRIGFIFPLQRSVQMVDIRYWDYSHYLRMLVGISKPQITVLGPDLTKLFPVGRHLFKNEMCKTFKQWGKMFVDTTPFPIQMFLRSPQGKAKKLSLGEFEGLPEIIQKYKIPYFTHAPYTINLCKDAKEDDGTPWARNILIEDIKLTSKLGGKGVVVHTGSACGIKKRKGLDTMETMIRASIGHATQECKLLLETPCGEGKEVCASIQTMNQFLSRFTEEERTKLGLCIDTAHIHAAGYNVLEYILEWIDTGLVGVHLVHYNDSEVCCGTCTDRHQVPGLGKIGYETMFNVAVLCSSKGIPMVFE